MRASKLCRAMANVAALAALIAVVGAHGATPKQWTTDELAKALSDPSRPQADRDRDENRKPAQLMTYFGVKPGMTVLDVFAAGGYLTEVLSITVGPNGKVYMQNPAMMAGRAAQRTENNRLPNVVRVDGNLPNPALPANSADFAITALNFHDIYGNGGQAAGETFMKGVFDSLKPGGTFAVIDHAGNDGADNSKLHRVSKQAAIATATATGFVLDGESNLLANSADDRSTAVRDANVRGKTDQFVLRFKKPS
jgi:predicted methyltransferase